MAAKEDQVGEERAPLQETSQEQHGPTNIQPTRDIADEEEVKHDDSSQADDQVCTVESGEL